MGNVSEKVEAASVEISNKGASTQPETPKKLKPCCACPETKKVRDAWSALVIVCCRYVTNSFVLF